MQFRLLLRVSNIDLHLWIGHEKIGWQAFNTCFDTNQTCLVLLQLFFGLRFKFGFSQDAIVILYDHTVPVHNGLSALKKRQGHTLLIVEVRRVGYVIICRAVDVVAFKVLL